MADMERMQSFHIRKNLYLGVRQSQSAYFTLLSGRIISVE